MLRRKRRKKGEHVDRGLVTTITWAFLSRRRRRRRRRDTLTEAWSPPGARPLHLEPSCPHSARQPAPRDLLLPLAFPYARVQCWPDKYHHHHHHHHHPSGASNSILHESNVDFIIIIIILFIHVLKLVHTLTSGSGSDWPWMNLHVTQYSNHMVHTRLKKSISLEKGHASRYLKLQSPVGCEAHIYWSFQQENLGCGLLNLFGNTEVSVYFQILSRFFETNHNHLLQCHYFITFTCQTMFF